MRLFIAEKPELAAAIVEGLGGGTKRNGYYECPNKDRVTWCYGHMLQLCEPEEYDERYAKWHLADLPMAFIPWRKKPNPRTKDQLKIILGLLKEATEVVHAGDPDPEGQLLVDEILEYAKCRVPVKRVLINDNTPALVRQSLANLRDNGEFAGLSSAAEARSVGDQLYGFNMTRAYTLAARQAGHDGLLSVGRVQTPILGLVVRRDQEHEGHKKALYYVVKGFFDVTDTGFSARYIPREGDPVDPKGRIINADCARKVVADVSGHPARVVSVKSGEKADPPPLPFNLLKLQVEASKRFDMKPDEVLDVTQTLRERHKLITYNRSDCQYLIDEHHAAAPAVLAAVRMTLGETLPLIGEANPALKSRAFNPKKVSAHHAIIPTQATAKLADLTEAERRIYTLIATWYLAQFLPPYRYQQTDVTIEGEAERQFRATSRVPLETGWKALFTATNNDETETTGGEEPDADERDTEASTTDLSRIREQDLGACTRAEALERETKPLPRYTMATLLTDLTRAANYVKDPKLREILIEKDKDKAGEHGGIGTPATRDKIIKNLFDRGFLAEKGKQILSTTTGRDFYALLPDQAKFPDMTALWHIQQKGIEEGKGDCVSFVQGLGEYIAGEVGRVKREGLEVMAAADVPKCPACGRALRRIKGTKGAFWGCTGYADGCKATFNDEGGKPVFEKQSVEAPWAATTQPFKCPKCGRDLVRRKRKSDGKPFWGCSGFAEGCRTAFDDSLGRPKFEKMA